MARYLNKTTLIGNLGGAPELRHTAKGIPVCNFSVATSERWTDKESGQERERTEWHKVTVWGTEGENCAKYLGKGSKVYVDGPTRHEKWTDSENQERSSTYVEADRVIFLDPKATGAAD